MASSLNSWSGRCQSEQIQEQLCQRVLLLAQTAGVFFPEPQAATLTDTTLSRGVLVEPGLLGGSTPSYAVVQSGRFQRYTLDAVRLYGVEFRIYDCRNRASLSDKISLLFVRGEESDLNGHIVELYPLKETRDQIVGAAELGDGEILYRLSNGSTIRTGSRDFERPEEWLIQPPTLHLRYYLEKWTRRFFCVDQNLLHRRFGVLRPLGRAARGELFSRRAS